MKCGNDAHTYYSGFLVGVSVRDYLWEEAKRWKSGTKQALKNEITAAMLREMEPWSVLHNLIPGRKYEPHKYPSRSHRAPLNLFAKGVPLGPYRYNGFATNPLNKKEKHNAGRVVAGYDSGNLLYDNFGLIKSVQFLAGLLTDWSRFHYTTGHGKFGISFLVVVLAIKGCAGAQSCGDW